MKNTLQIEHRASSSRGKHEGESSYGLCDRLSRTRDNSQRQLPTDQDYAVSTREYQTDQSSLKPAPTAAKTRSGWPSPSMSPMAPPSVSKLSVMKCFCQRVPGGADLPEFSYHQMPLDIQPVVTMSGKPSW